MGIGVSGREAQTPPRRAGGPHNSPPNCVVHLSSVPIPRWTAVPVVLLLLTAASSNAGQSAPVALLHDGPPAPAAPAVIARDGEGRATIRAVRVTRPLRIDGRLEEPI